MKLINCIFRQPNLFGVQTEGQRMPECLFCWFETQTRWKNELSFSWKGQSSVKIIQSIPHFCSSREITLSCVQNIWEDAGDQKKGTNVIDLLMLPHSMTLIYFLSLLMVKWKFHSTFKLNFPHKILFFSLSLALSAITILLLFCFSHRQQFI